MEVLDISDLRMQYTSLCELVARDGHFVEPRGMPTRELTDVALVLPSPAAATLPTRIGRGVSTTIFAAELMQWIAGVSDLSQLAHVSNERFRSYSDDGTRLYGAYGPRAYRGLERAVKVLQSDTLSRQASVSLWRSLESDQTADLPCTLSWSFKIRGGELEMMTVMRSNDVWTGVAYDVPAMARIQSAVSWALNVPAGRYTHVAQSLHLYERDLEHVAKLDISPTPLEPDDEGIAPLLAPEILRWNIKPIVPESRWRTLRDQWAHGALHPSDYVMMPTEFEWYAERLHDHPGYVYFCPGCRYYLPQPELMCSATLP